MVSKTHNFSYVAAVHMYFTLFIIMHDKSIAVYGSIPDGVPLMSMDI